MRLGLGGVAEVDDVAVLDDVFLAFEAHLAVLLHACIEPRPVNAS